jgi:two-component sensor histidine kinase
MYMNDNAMLAGWRRSADASVLDAPPDLLEFLPVAVYACDLEGRLRWHNRRASELWDCEPQIGDDALRFGGAFRLRRVGGRPLRSERSPMARALRGTAIRGEKLVIERHDGSQRICDVHIDPVRNTSGKVIGAIACLHDVTDLHRAGEDHVRRERDLEGELNHRVRNTLAAVQCLAAQILPRTGAPSPALDAFAGRLVALSRTHELLTESSWGGADFDAILAGALAPHGDRSAGRVFRSGGSVPLPPRAALALAVVLHELVSNAARHGALSTDKGRLDLAWRVEGSDAARGLNFEWVESGGPSVAAPSRPGFGSRLIERSVCAELGGTVRTSYDTSGFTCSILVPLV